jgi:hypothetical protein
MAAIRLLIDEDVRPLLAETLRQRGFDARHVDELKRSGLSDLEQLAFAVKERRALLTHNIRHYLLLDREYRYIAVSPGFGTRSQNWSPLRWKNGYWIVGRSSRSRTTSKYRRNEPASSSESGTLFSAMTPRSSRSRMLRSKTGLCGRSCEPRLSRRRLYSRSSHSSHVFSVTNMPTRGSLSRSDPCFHSRPGDSREVAR